METMERYLKIECARSGRPTGMHYVLPELQEEVRVYDPSCYYLLSDEPVYIFYEEDADGFVRDFVVIGAATPVGGSPEPVALSSESASVLFQTLAPVGEQLLADATIRATFGYEPFSDEDFSSSDEEEEKSLADERERLCRLGYELAESLVAVE